MTQARVTTAETSESLRFFLELSSVFTVDDNGFVVYLDDTSKKALIKGTGAADAKKPLVVYREVMPQPSDYYIVNPYAEGLGLTTPSASFFYSSLRGGLVGRLVVLIQSMVRFMQSQKGIEFQDAGYQISGAPKVLLDLATARDSKRKPVADLVDDKTYANIASYLKSPAVNRDLLYIAYSKNSMVSSLRIDMISDPEFAETQDLGKLRKADFQVLRGLLMKIFGVDTPDEMDKYTCPAIDGAPPKLSSWLHVLFMAYRAINPALVCIDSDCVIDLTGFKYHLDNLPEYSGNARFMVQGNAPRPTTQQAIPGTATGAPLPGSTLPQPTPGTAQGSVIPGVIRADGSVAAPTQMGAYGTPVPQFPAMGMQMQPGMVPPPIPNMQMMQPGVQMMQPGMQMMPGMMPGVQMQPGVPMMQPGMQMQPGMPMMPAAMGFNGIPSPIPNMQPGMMPSPWGVQGMVR